MALVEPSYPRNGTSPLHTSLEDGGSRLLKMKARFQQRQLAEKEQKLLQLYQNQQQKAFARVGGSANGSSQTNLDSSSILGASLGAGKVRQLFDGRRGAAAGRDRSHPLEPLHSTDSSIHTRALPSQLHGRSAPLTSNRRSQSLVRPAPGKQITRSINKSPPPSISGNLEGQFNSKKIVSENSINSQVFGKLVNVGNMQRPKPTRTSASLTSTTPKIRTQGTIGVSSTTRTATTNPTTTRSPPTQLAPKKSPEIKEAAPPPTRGVIRKTTLTSPISTPSTTVAKVSPRNNVNNTNNRNSSPKSNVDSPREAPSSTQTIRSPTSNTNSDLSECKICGRRFNSDRISAHEKICVKSTQKKRKIFDPVKQRVKGTEAETYVLHRPPGASSANTKPVKKGDWRKKHEEFISTIRAAKQVKEHLAKGGKLSDLPPPPPMDTSDYVPCPHCGRKFNDAAAERHIPLCARMLHNKPKPNTSRRR